MKRDKYVGMDVHQSMRVVAVMNAEGKIVLETMVPTAASRIRELIESLSGPLHVTLEEGPLKQLLDGHLEAGGYAAEKARRHLIRKSDLLTRGL